MCKKGDGMVALKLVNIMSWVMGYLQVRKMFREGIFRAP